ncbi:MAG: tetratricopeptide repeat protein [Bacteroidetes bacterium]|nr:tetratricopeptide repeat protein [Bacteroidota bacterium]
MSWRRASNCAIDYNNLGGAYDSKGRFDKAIDYHNKALAIDKNIMAKCI